MEPVATHRSPTAVIKFGGEVIATRPRLLGVLTELEQLIEEGWRFVICHGGGPQSTALGRRLGLEPVMEAGQRVTDRPTLEVVCQVLAGQVSCAVVAAARAARLDAIGISCGVVVGRRRPPVRLAEGAGRVVDYGFVGDIVSVDRRPLDACWAAGLTPIVNPIALAESDEDPGLLNVNGDTVAAAIAAELGVDHLFMLTSVPGVLRDRNDPGSRVPHLTRAEARRAVAEGVIAGGMIPKVEEALAALDRVGAVHILAANAGALASEARLGGSEGTVLIEPSHTEASEIASADHQDLALDPLSPGVRGEGREPR